MGHSQSPVIVRRFSSRVHRRNGIELRESVEPGSARGPRAGLAEMTFSKETGPSISPARGPRALPGDWIFAAVFGLTASLMK